MCAAACPKLPCMPPGSPGRVASKAAPRTHDLHCAARVLLPSSEPCTRTCLRAPPVVQAVLPPLLLLLLLPLLPLLLLLLPACTLQTGE